METRRFTRWAAAAVLTGLVLALAACGGSSSDNAGGTDKAEPRVLTMANPNPSAAAAIPDGVYRTSFTLPALERSPKLLDAEEINDENWGDFTLTLGKGRVTFEQTNDVASYSTSGTFAVDGDSIVMEFTDGGNAGEIFAFRWSLYRDTLTFRRDAALGVAPTPYLVNAWHRVG